MKAGEALVVFGVTEERFHRLFSLPVSLAAILGTEHGPHPGGASAVQPAVRGVAAALVGRDEDSGCACRPPPRPCASRSSSRHRPRSLRAATARTSRRTPRSGRAARGNRGGRGESVPVIEDRHASSETIVAARRSRRCCLSYSSGDRRRALVRPCSIHQLEQSDRDQRDPDDEQQDEGRRPRAMPMTSSTGNARTTKRIVRRTFTANSFTSR